MKLSSTDFEMASQLWPKDKFGSEEEWKKYVMKWWPKLPSITARLDDLKKTRSMNESKMGSYSYSCHMASMSPEDSFFVLRNLVSTLNPSDLIWEDGKGAELEPHITVLYGIHETSARPFIDVCSKIATFSVGVTGLSIFEGDQYDVLKLDIESDELRDLNQFIRDRFEHTSSFPDYHPHLTIGYLKKGRSSLYVGNGDTRMINSLTITGFTFSSSSQIRGKVSIPCMNPNLNLVDRLLAS